MSIDNPEFKKTAEAWALLFADPVSEICEASERTAWNALVGYIDAAIAAKAAS